MANAGIARAIVVDSRLLFGEMLQTCLAKGGHTILGQAQTLDEALMQIDTLHPNLVILGPELAEHSLCICREIICYSPESKVIIFSKHADEPLFQADAFQVGASACPHAEITIEELQVVIDQVLSGQRLFPHESYSLAFQPIELTRREREVLRLIVDGKSDKEIADALGLKFNTVRNHTQHILEKLGVHSRQEAMWRARSRGLV